MDKRNFEGMAKSFILGLACLVSVTTLVSCSDSSGSSDGFERGSSTAFVLTTDFSTGSGSTIDLATLEASEDIVETGAIHSDATAVYYSDIIYVINRLGMDSITMLDASDGSVLNQFDLGASTNPYDMAFVSEAKAYICLYGSNDLLVVDPTDTGNEIQERIDLSPYLDPADTDGNVEAACLEIVGDYLFVTLQMLDGWAASREGVIAVIKISDNSLIDVDETTGGTQGIVLTGQNPQFMAYDNTLNKLLVSETGSYFAVDGGIEQVDPSTFEAEGFLVEEDDTNGNAMGAFVVIDDIIYAAIGTGYDLPVVMEFTPDAETGAFTKSDDIFTATAYLPSLTADGFDRLIIPDREPTNPGVRFYDTTTGNFTDLVDVGLPPKLVITF